MFEQWGVPKTEHMFVLSGLGISQLFHTPTQKSRYQPQALFHPRKSTISPTLSKKSPYRPQYRKTLINPTKSHPPLSQNLTQTKHLKPYNPTKINPLHEIRNILLYIRRNSHASHSSHTTLNKIKIPNLYLNSINLVLSQYPHNIRKPRETTESIQLITHTTHLKVYIHSNITPKVNI